MFTKLNSFTKKVQDLPDQPALTPADLKAQFDAAPDELRQSFNTLVDALTSTASGDSGAKNVGVTTISGVTGNDVQTVLTNLAAQLAPTGGLLLNPSGSGSGYPLSGTNYTPSKPLSQCRNGWKFVWQSYNPSTSTANDWGYQYTYIDKNVISQVGAGKAHWINLSAGESNSAVTKTTKVLYFSDTYYVGHDDNNSATTNANQIILKGVYEW